MSEQGIKRDDLDREIVETLLESGAVNFDAIGAALAKYGPQAALGRADDEWENFCLTMKIFIRLYRHPIPPRLGSLGIEDLAKLREAVGPELSD